MKRITRHFFFSSSQKSPFFHHLSNPTLLLHTRPSSSSSPSPPQPHSLTPEELTKINLLLPRLCESNHFHEAIRLIDTVLLTNPPLNTISLPILINQLSSQPNMTQSMALLNRLKHNSSSHPHILYISKLLVNCYLKKRRFKEVMKVVGWIWRFDTPVEMDVDLYRIVVRGFCKGGLTLEGLIVVKKMVEDKVVVGDDMRGWVYKCLLREARIKEAKEFTEALSCDLKDGKDEDFQRVVSLLDQMIKNWTE